MPAILLQQMVVADWRQPFVLFNPSCAKDRHAESQDSCFCCFLHNGNHVPGTRGYGDCRGKVDHVPAGFYTADGHTSQDLYYGWFAGRMSLDLTSTIHVDDVFVTTEKLGDPATVKVTVEVTNKGAAAFDGEAVIHFFPWYPFGILNGFCRRSCCFPTRCHEGHDDFEKRFGSRTAALGLRASEPVQGHCHTCQQVRKTTG